MNASSFFPSLSIRFVCKKKVFANILTPQPCKVRSFIGRKLGERSRCSPFLERGRKKEKEGRKKREREREGKGERKKEEEEREHNFLDPPKVSGFTKLFVVFLFILR